MNDWKKAVASNIKRLKGIHGMSQDLLAEEAGCSKSVIRDLEAGIGSASLDMLTKISQALGVKLNEILDDGGPKTMLELPVSKTLQKMMSIPDFLYEEAQKFGVNHGVWDRVRIILEDEEKDMGLMAKPKKTKQS